MADVKILFDNKDGLAKIRATQLFMQGNATMMLEMAVFQVSQIKVRTAAGKDHEGNPFREYKPGYKIFKAAAGHPVNKVNLLFTGKMLASMSGKAISQKESRVFFASPQETDKANKNQVDFPFFGFNKSDKAGMIRIYNEYLEKAMR